MNYLLKVTEVRRKLPVWPRIFVDVSLLLIAWLSVAYVFNIMGLGDVFYLLIAALLIFILIVSFKNGHGNDLDTADTAPTVFVVSYAALLVAVLEANESLVSAIIAALMFALACFIWKEVIE